MSLPALRGVFSMIIRAGLLVVSGWIEHQYASTEGRDWIASFRSFIAAVTELTIDLPREFHRCD
ncbi:MAG: hypothetical protein EOS58_29735 [Mesorhizobium sp.]|uniref:hypothetical protein n=1 Tax=Mesorhizobium sp. TaxID=1871066 RepID=UPI000FD4417A|nr:hypothetical protein [Mesorhizobium sp.]RVD69947.1 hypothetical protein EN751_23360 [Mesorhizobium sp. M4A.F.Ca.ET.029.04.2.1]RWD00473.1 MAG: hypothetical protein EOS58_29735 [Mesorhizobium sp.]TIW33161.1 MAG: hypothetical protein E5V62_21830 [Mesorhizobium sp.]